MKSYYWWLMLGLGAVNDGVTAESKNPKEVSLQNVQHEQSRLRQLIAEAIAKFERTERADWAYQVSRYESEEGDVSSSLEQFEPHREMREQWSLLRINGAQPSHKQRQHFIERKLEQADKDANISLQLADLIQLNSLQLESDGPVHVQARFDVYLEKLGQDASDKLRGVLRFNKQQQFIERIEIVNTAPFSPVFSAKISEFKLVMDFYHIDGAILPHQNILNMKGTFAFFTEIDEVSTDTYSNYQYQRAAVVKLKP